MHPIATTVVRTSSVRFMTTTVLHIDGMSCQNCVRHVTEALQKVAGVSSATVSLETASARVSSHGHISVDALTAAVKAAGYSATV